jgi:hypothetical protein
MREIISSVYLAAMIDGEGTIHWQKEKQSRAVVIYNTEMEIIDKCKNHLDSIGVRSYIVKTKNQCTHGFQLNLTITGQNSLLKLYNSVSDYMCSRKRDKFKLMNDSYKNKMSKSAI